MTTNLSPAEREKHVLSLVESISAASRQEVITQRSIGEGRRGFSVVSVAPDGAMRVIGTAATWPALEGFLEGVLAGLELAHAAQASAATGEVEE